MNQLRKLYKKDSKGKVRVWWMEVNGDAYRVVSGILDGKMVESDFKVAKPKNVGRSNATTGEQQALLECESKYEDQLTHGKYTDDLSKVDEVSSGGYFEPMLAIKWDDEKGKQVGKKWTEKAFAAGHRVFVQPKLDGYRCIGQADGLHTRNGETFSTVPHIHFAIKDFHDKNPNGVLDGELYNHAYHDNFNEIQRMIAPGATPTPERLQKTLELVQYHVYDAYFPDEPNAPFSLRQSYLQYMAETGLFGESIVFVETVEVTTVDEITKAYEDFLAQGYEGAMVRIDTPYECDRSKNLIKVKPEYDDEYTILAVNEGEGNWSGKAKTMSFKTADGKEFDATLRGTMEENRKLLDIADQVVGLQATVVFPNKTPDGIPRFGRVKEIWWKGKRNL